MVYVRLQGSLGSLMFQRAAAISLKRGNMVGVGDVSLSRKLRNYGDLFKGVSIVPAPPMNLAIVRQKQSMPVKFPPADGRDLYLEGGFQSENYFDRDLVYDWAKPIEGRASLLLGKYRAWLQRPGVTGISVRRGDYLRQGAATPFVGEQYFRDAIAQLPDVKDFIVCSDDLLWCRNFFATAFPGRRFLFIEEENVLDQLAMQTFCENNVISNCPFSWWGGWLAKERRLREGKSGRVLAPSMWYGYAAQKDGVTWDDIYFEGTEVVPNTYNWKTWLTARWPALAGILPV